MYGERADLYDRIYHWKDYDAEVARIVEILAGEGVGPGARVLDTACGTGEHLRRLSGSFDVTGLDLSDEMIAIARRKAPGVPFLRADLADFLLDPPCDAVLCLFSSIGYLLGEERLRAAAASLAQATRPGGVLVVEPWISPETFRPGHVHLHTYDTDDLKIARAAHSVVRGDRSIVEFHWLVARTGEGVEHFVEEHECWLCPRERMGEILDAAGFEIRFEEDGLMKDRGLFLGRRRG
jgi:SAM-dependent methyltransferase